MSMAMSAATASAATSAFAFVTAFGILRFLGALTCTLTFLTCTLSAWVVLSAALSAA